jgi:hypothetical protein
MAQTENSSKTGRFANIFVSSLVVVTAILVLVVIAIKVAALD